MKVAVILSMKHGMEHFIYRELSIIAEQGADISLFPTKTRPGPYMSKPEWRTTRWNPLIVLLCQPWFALRSPRAYFFLMGKAIRFGALMDFLLAWYFAAHMRDADVIYSIFGDHKLFIGYFCKFILGKPLVTTLHAYELYQNPNPVMFIEALQQCDQVITVTEYNRELLQSRFGLDPARVEVVRVCVNTEDFRPTHKFIVLIVGYFDSRKGHDTLFHAVKELDMDDLEVWVVGDMTGRADPVNVRHLARELGVDSQVAFFGELSGNALKAVYRACDVFCAPSRHDEHGIAEGFPTVLMEAMSFGKPVITTRHVEIPRIVPEIIVEENDSHGLAQAIKRLRQSESLREEQGRANREIAERLFSTRNAQQTAHILFDVAAGRWA
ncbi:MAG: glycosyltransferase [Anaerolineaceae bacterium]|nr:MAG: glycosyltransferase [Anaerolineaceae bacterium]